MERSPIGVTHRHRFSPIKIPTGSQMQFARFLAKGNGRSVSSSSGGTYLFEHPEKNRSPVPRDMAGGLFWNWL
jgi:hypothetical protein